MVWSTAQTPDVYTLPSVRFIGSGAPAWLADSAVLSFSLERELVASVIPGTLRSRGGLSIGAASATVENADYTPATPWSNNLDKRVEVDLDTFGLYAVDGDDQLNLGHWALEPVAGSLTGGAIDVDLIEAQYVGRRTPQALQPYKGEPFSGDAPVDPCWIVGQMARRAGFWPTPRSTLYPALQVAADGAFHADQVAALFAPHAIDGESTGWEVLPGDVAVGGAPGSYFSATSTSIALAPYYWRQNAAVYLTLNVVGTVYIYDVQQGWQIRIVNNSGTGTHTVAVCNSGDGTFTTPVTFTPGLSPDWPNRVQVYVGRQWDVTLGLWTSVLAMARSASGGPWSSIAQDTTDFTPTGDAEMIYVSGGRDHPAAGIVGAAAGQFAAFQMNGLSAPSSLWEASKAHLKPLGGDVGLPWAPASMDAWTVIQSACSAHLGAAILSDGVLTMLDRDDLSGSNTLGEDADIGREWTDLPWVLDPNDRADRVEVTFTPPAISKAVPGSSELAPEAWRADEVILIPALATVTIPAQMDNLAAVGIFENFITPTTPSANWSKSSNIFAFNNAAGTGSALGLDLLSVSLSQTSATTATVTIRNLTGAPIYLVDSTGAPGLVLRAETVATYETQQLVERGLPADQAANPLAVDLSPWVQREQDAVSVADYLWARVSGKGLWKAGSIRCRVDWSHDIGKVIRLKHPSTGLEAKALITKVAYDGTAGEITQSIDLVLLPWTWGDFDAMTAATPGMDTWAEFDAKYFGASKDWNDFDADPLWTGA